jgi:hypothetical protein
VHETIDGEAILLDLNTGNYFSLEGSGALIWDFIDKFGDWQRAIELITSGNEANDKLVAESVAAFVQELFDEKLLVVFEKETDEPIIPDVEDQLKAIAKDFTPPKVNKYSDMQDLLLLDPIHEVDEKGWPESREVSEDGKSAI